MATVVLVIVSLTALAMLPPTLSSVGVRLHRTQANPGSLHQHRLKLGRPTGALAMYGCFSSRMIEHRVLKKAGLGATPAIRHNGLDAAAASVSAAAGANMENHRFFKAIKGEEVDQIPIWLFRQAGPYLPEYNKYKRENNVSFLDIIRSPEHSSQVAMQPLERYGLDAAILFSDILTIAEGMGMELQFPPGKGMTVSNVLQGPSDIDSTLIMEPSSLHGFCPRCRVITLDKNIDVGEALGALEETAWVTGRRATVQGNLDPQLLLANSTREAITGAVESMIARVGKQATIANLGGGLMGKEDPDLVAHYVEEVRRLSRRRAE
eukprot:jgi/Bigna1/68242/fgenesh1_pg.5_\